MQSALAGWTRRIIRHSSTGLPTQAGRGSLTALAAVLVLLSIQGVAWASPQLYSHGDPSANEQYMLELINRARANPAAEGQRLATTTDTNVLGAYSFYGVNTSTVISDFNSYSAVPPLAFNPILISTARAHSNLMVTDNSQSHQLPNEPDLGTRITNAGYTGWSSLGENIYAYCFSVFYGHAGLQVDWGNPGLGHRINIMGLNGTDYQEIGIGIVNGPGNGNGNQTGPLVITQDFGLISGNNYLLGVAYDHSASSDGSYAPGSGISGVTITLSQRNNYAVTSTSGGYAIPINGLSGNVTVTAVGNGVDAQTTVNLTGNNVKVDFGKVDLFNGSAVNGANMKWSSWFGYYNYAAYPIVYEFNLGYEYVYDAGNGGVYLFDYHSGHFWYTQGSYYPFVYDYSLNTFLYYYTNNANGATRYFFNYAANKVITE